MTGWVIAQVLDVQEGMPQWVMSACGISYEQKINETIDW